MSIVVFFIIYFITVVSAVSFAMLAADKSTVFFVYLSSGLTVGMLCIAYKISNGVDLYLMFAAYMVLFGLFLIRIKKSKKGW